MLMTSFLHFYRIRWIVHWAILYTRLQFSMEVSVNDRICFLDTTIIIDNQRIIFDTYHKATFSGRFLNFYSNHSLCHIKGKIISFFRQNILSVLAFYMDALTFNKNKLMDAIHTFFENSYPLFYFFHNGKKIKILYIK